MFERLEGKVCRPLFIVFRRWIIKAVLLFGLCFPFSAIAQQLEIDSVYLGQTDTLSFGDTVNVSLFARNTADTNLLGNLKIWFRNESNQFVELPLGGFNALQFFAPFQQRQLFLKLIITPEFFIEGGNTVVIWPSFVGEPLAPAIVSLRRTIYVRMINSLANIQKQESGYFLSNPFVDVLKILPEENSPIPISIIIRDLEGRMLIQKRYDSGEEIEVSKLLPGIYLLELQLPNGKRHVRKIVKLSH